MVEAKKNEQLNQILDGMSLRKGFDGETTKRYEKPRIKQLRPRAIWWKEMIKSGKKKLLKKN